MIMRLANPKHQELTPLPMSSFCIALLGSLLFSSCFVYKVAREEPRSADGAAIARKKGFILNPGQVKEAEIIRVSGIYQFTRDSLDPAAVRIHLSPLKIKHLDDGPGIIVGILTLGQVPITYHDAYSFSFTESGAAADDSKTYTLNISKQYWFWHLLSFKKHFNRKAGQALSIAYLTDRPNN